MSHFYPDKLTRHPEGSVKELWAISFPLILSMLSINLMTFVDGLLLSKYNTHAMNAAVVAGLAVNVFQGCAVGITSIAGVFVGQFNGAKKFHQLGEPVWQMIWFSLATILLFIPLGLWAGPFFIPNTEYLSEGIPYFKWMMFFSPAFPLEVALSAFFVARGEVRLVMVTSILCNVLNIALDFLLIYGVPNWIPALGAGGAAIATGVAQILQAAVFLSIFLRPRHQKLYGTHHWRFNLKLCTHSLKIGLPNALSSLIELSAWCILSQILATVSEAHITIYSIGDKFFTLFSFGFWGLQKGIIAIVSNASGPHRSRVISQCLKSGIKIVLGIMLIFTIPLFFFPETLVSLFLSPETSLETNLELMSYAATSMRWLWVYFMFDVTAWVICGVLIAAGDTKFIMMMNGFAAWAFSVLPTYLFLRYWDASPATVWVLCALYGALNTVSFYWRYKSRRWAKRQLLFT